MLLECQTWTLLAVTEKESRYLRASALGNCPGFLETLDRWISQAQLLVSSRSSSFLYTMLPFGRTHSLFFFFKYTNTICSEKGEDVIVSEEFCKAHLQFGITLGAEVTFFPNVPVRLHVWFLFFGVREVTGWDLEEKKMLMKIYIHRKKYCSIFRQEWIYVDDTFNTS